MPDTFTPAGPTASGSAMAAPLRVLIGCETSGRVRNALLACGRDAWSCDLPPSEDRSNRHMICDVREVPGDSWATELEAA